MNAMLNVGAVVQAVLRPLRRRIWWLIGGGSIAVIVGCLLHSLPRWTEERRVDSLRAASFPVRSINPADDRFEDLLPLVQVIGERRFVLMTETTHDDGATFDARTRLSRFLHQKMGFDVVCIESSYATMWDLDQAMRTEKGYSEFTRRNTRSLPSLTTERSLLEYIRSTRNGGQRPIALMGCHIYYDTDTQLLPKLRRYLAAVDPQPLTAAQVERFEAILKPLTTGRWPTTPTSSSDVTDFEALTSILEQKMQDQGESLRRKLSVEDFAHFESLVCSLPAFVNSTTVPMPHDAELHREQLNRRDKTMADLIIRASRGQYANRKMVIVAAGAHLLPGASGFSAEFAASLRLVQMGECLRRTVGRDQTYTIVFEAYSGNTGKAPGYSIGEASPRTLAALFHKLGDPYCFLDLSGLPSDHWLRRVRIGVRALTYRRDGWPAIWPDVCDAIFYIDEMRPVQ